MNILVMLVCLLVHKSSQTTTSTTSAHDTGQGSCVSPPPSTPGHIPEGTDHCTVDVSKWKQEEAIQEPLSVHIPSFVGKQDEDQVQQQLGEGGLNSHNGASTKEDVWGRPLVGGGSAEGGGGDTEGAVWPLRKESHFLNFISRASVTIIYFYRKRASESESLGVFLRDYGEAAVDLLHYNINLATVDCLEFPAMPYCGPDKVEHFAYGFREGQEKIAFPLDTLFNANAIVASALHLALINTVPILQTATERRDLEARCKGRCNIIFAFLRTLGTIEHRTFLEVAITHQDDFVFAITTYTAGTLGLPGPLPSEEERESSVWVVHCWDKQVREDCVVSQYREEMTTPALTRLLHLLHLPLWHQLSMASGSSAILTPYDGWGLPWAVLVYDGTSRARVLDLAPHLAQLLHGSVAILTLDLEDVSEGALLTLGLTPSSIIPPAIAYLRPGQEEDASLLNDYDDPLMWVKEQLEIGQQEANKKEQQLYLPVHPLAKELQHDDETVLGMVGEKTFANIPVLTEEAHSRVLASDPLPVLAYYLPWDPVSNALLQHLSLVVAALASHPTRASIYRLDCFDLPQLCGEHTFPTLHIHPKPGRNITYEGPIHRDYILRAILLLEPGAPVEVVGGKALEGLMNLDTDIHPAAALVTASTVGVFPATEDAVSFNKAVPDLETSHLLGLHISTLASFSMCGSSHGCVVVSKPSDTFQPRRVLSKDLDKPNIIASFIKHSSLPVLAKLEPERHSALEAVSDLESPGPHRKHLVILFLPVDSPQIPSYGKDGSDEGAVERDDWGSKIGTLAAEMSEPGFIFSWLPCDDPLAVELAGAYGLETGVRSVVALQVGPDATTLHHFPPTNTSLAAFKDWFTRLRNGHIPLTASLPEGQWEPRLGSINFLKLLYEDQDRDAEDHLILEMEADLSANHYHHSHHHHHHHSHHHHDDEGKVKMFQKEM